jgi:hypothetical protein
LEELTQIEEPLLADPSLFGAGLHQSMNGAFLNVHVDYNIHPETKFHRRLNVLVYMNPNWKEEYEGHIELWDLTGKERKQLGRFSPDFNRCVIFETNEISFHGHPKKLNTPEGVSRKSLATYYYTKNRPAHEACCRAQHDICEPRRIARASKTIELWRKSIFRTHQQKVRTSRIMIAYLSGKITFQVPNAHLSRNRGHWLYGENQPKHL